MKMGAIAGIGIAVVLVLAAFGSYVSASNQGNAIEQRLKAKKQDNENVLSSGYQQLQGTIGVTTMATEDNVKVFTAAIQGRYGKDGSRAVFQMLKEQNPTIDPALYRKVQQVVESTQKEFQNSQTQMLDIKRSYETMLGSFWQGMWLHIAGYPKINLDDYKIVSSGDASDAFRTGKQGRMGDLMKRTPSEAPVQQPAK